MPATLSIWGLWNWDNRIFDRLHIPEQIDREKLIGTLLSECAELEVVYPDWDLMECVIHEWSSTMLPQWHKLYATTVMEYNPIENYDREEEWDDNGENTASQPGFNNPTMVDTGQSKGKSHHHGRMHGNIGVTTSQQMLQQERAVAYYNIYEQIVKDFKRKFCLLVY